MSMITYNVSHLYTCSNKLHMLHDLVTSRKEMKCSPTLKAKKGNHCEAVRMNCEMKRNAW